MDQNNNGTPAPVAPVTASSDKKTPTAAIIIAALVVAGGIVAAVLLSQNKSSDGGEKKDETSEEKKVKNPAADDSAYTVKINGKTFTAGDKVSSLEEAGYAVRESVKNEKVPAGKYLLLIGGGSVYNKDEDVSISFTPYNDTEESLTIPNAKLGKITIEKSTLEKKQAIFEKIEFYGGIKLGSTREELVKAFGEPTSATERESYDGSKYETIEYKDKVYKKFEFKIEEGVVTEMEWTNYGDLAK